MRLFVFSVKDDKIGNFSNPFFALSKGQAVRNFGDLCKDSNSSIAKHPEDYRLFLIGQFDDETATFENVSSGPELVSSGSDWIEDGSIRRVK